jgi:hypothetical protein
MKIRSGVMLFGLFVILSLVSAAVSSQVVSAQVGQATPAATQPADCPDFVKAAVDATGKACADLGRNQACYGNTLIRAEPQSGITDFAFDSPGQIIPVASIQNMQLSSLNTDNTTWGIAVFKVQANLPDTAPSQNVTMLMFGDVQLENSVATPSKMVDVTTTGNATVRLTPSNAGQVVAKLTPNATASAVGKLKDGSWLRVQWPSADGKSTLKGWLPAQSVSIKTPSDVDSLDVIDPKAPTFGPMQAIYFRSGVGAPACKTAPRDGILIHTPHQPIKVSLQVNGAKLTFASAGFLQSANGKMTVSTFEGGITIEAGGKSVYVPAGMQCDLPIDANGKVIGPPGLPKPYNLSDFQGLPLSLLPDKITIAQPLFTNKTSNTGGTGIGGTGTGGTGSGGGTGTGGTGGGNVGPNGKPYCASGQVPGPCVCRGGVHVTVGGGGSSTVCL